MTINEQTETNTEMASGKRLEPLKPATPKRKGAARQIDPGVAAIRKQASAQIAEYHKKQRSGGVLKNIIDKQLPKLIDSDREKLGDLLCKTTTAPLVPDETFNTSHS